VTVSEPAKHADDFAPGDSVDKHRKIVPAKSLLNLSHDVKLLLAILQYRHHIMQPTRGIKLQLVPSAKRRKIWLESKYRNPNACLSADEPNDYVISEQDGSVEDEPKRKIRRTSQPDSSRQGLQKSIQDILSAPPPETITSSLLWKTISEAKGNDPSGMIRPPICRLLLWVFGSNLPLSHLLIFFSSLVLQPHFYPCLSNIKPLSKLALLSTCTTMAFHLTSKMFRISTRGRTPL
jgi:hypothetical protein